MSIDALQAKIQRDNQYIDNKYKKLDRERAVVKTVINGTLLGAGYLGAKSIVKNKDSALKEALAGASDFVLKHLNNGIKHIDKKEKLTKITNLLQKAKEAPAKTKALIVFGTFIASHLISTVKGSSYIKGVLNQAKADEKVINTDRVISNYYNTENIGADTKPEFY